MTSTSPEVAVLQVSELRAKEVAPGVVRRSMPSTDKLHAWVIDFAPGTQWPEVDHHDTVEEVYIVSGEFIDGDVTYGAGSFLHFEPGSSHQPRTETGGRMFGYNLAVVI